MSSDPENMRSRREARRKKILASGENRLNRIVSTFSGHPVEPSEPKEQTAIQDAAPEQTTHVPQRSIDKPPISTTTAVSTPPTAETAHNQQLRQRLLATSVQSPGIPRTPIESTIYDSDTSPADILGEGRPIAEDIFEGGDAAAISALNEKLRAALQNAEETKLEAVPTEAPASSIFLKTLRLLSVIMLALFSVYIIARDFDELDEFLREDDEGWDSLDAPRWRVMARRVGQLAYRPISEGGDVEVGGVTLSIWVCFLTLELAMQMISWVYRQMYQPSASSRPGMLELASQLGFSSPRLEFIMKSVNDYRVIWESLLEDLFTFIFVIGITVALGHLVK